MSDFLTWLFGERGQIVLAGALGGVVRWLSLREDWRDGLISIVVGAICALYLGPLSIPMIEPVVGRIVADPTSRAGLSGFIIGIGGIAVAGFVIDVWHARSTELTRRRRQSDDDSN